jgi:hypothetical protein
VASSPALVLNASFQLSMFMAILEDRSLPVMIAKSFSSKIEVSIITAASFIRDAFG